MSRVAWVFPGQGSQALGMGADFLKSEPAFARTFARVEEITGIPVARVCIDGPAAELFDACVSGLIVFAMSAGLAGMLRRRSAPDAVAGFSIGQYAALHEAGLLSFEDAVRLVHERGLLLKAAAQRQPASLVGVIGLEAQVLEPIVAKTSGAHITAYSSPTNHTVACTPADADPFIQACLQAGAIHASLIPAAGGWHSPYVSTAQEPFARLLAEIKLDEFKTDYYDNVSGEKLANIDKLRANLVRHLCEPIRWTQCVRAMVADGVSQFIEVGYGRQLSQFIKFTNRRLSVSQTHDIPTWTAMLARLGPS